MEKRYVYKSTLRKVYGMTPSMIEELGEPDMTCENPNWKTGPYEASLYLIERVEAWAENNRERLEKARQSRQKRSAAMRAAHQRKQAEKQRRDQEQLERDQQWLMSQPVTLKKQLPSTLREDALKRKRFTGNIALQEERAIRNHVRHRYTNYNDLLRALSEREMGFELYPVLRERIDPVVEEALRNWRLVFEGDGAAESAQ